MPPSPKKIYQINFRFYFRIANMWEHRGHLFVNRAHNTQGGKTTTKKLCFKAQFHLSLAHPLHIWLLFPITHADIFIGGGERETVRAEEAPVKRLSRSRGSLWMIGSTLNNLGFLVPNAPCSSGFCPPAAAVTLHYSQSAKWNIILNICIVISSVTLTRTRVNKAINHPGTSKFFCNSS